MGLFPLIGSVGLFFPLVASAQITQKQMEQIYETVKTPYKYGLVVAPSDNYHKYDCPTVFRHDGRWYMTYVCYDGKERLGTRTSVAVFRH